MIKNFCATYSLGNISRNRRQLQVCSCSVNKRTKELIITAALLDVIYRMCALVCRPTTRKSHLIWIIFFSLIPRIRQQSLRVNSIIRAGKCLWVTYAFARILWSIDVQPASKWSLTMAAAHFALLCVSFLSVRSFLLRFSLFFLSPLPNTQFFVGFTFFACHILLYVYRHAFSPFSEYSLYSSSLLRSPTISRLCCIKSQNGVTA